jgi:hypothetical protein
LIVSGSTVSATGLQEDEDDQEPYYDSEEVLRAAAALLDCSGTSDAFHDPQPHAATGNTHRHLALGETAGGRGGGGRGGSYRGGGSGPKDGVVGGGGSAGLLPKTGHPSNALTLGNSSAAAVIGRTYLYFLFYICIWFEQYNRLRYSFKCIGFSNYTTYIFVISIF